MIIKTASTLQLDFGAQLWDQWLEVETFALASNKSLETLADYFRQRALIEVEYSQKLSKLAKPHKDEITRLATDKKGSVAVNRALLSSSTLQAWSQLLNETDSAAKVHAELAEKMDAEIKKAVKLAHADLDMRLKTKFEEIKKATGDLQKGIVLLDKAKDKFEADKKAMETAQSNFEKLLKNPKLNEKDVEVAKVELDKRRATTKNSMTAYQQTLIETNVKKNTTYMQIIPQLLNEINNDDQAIRISAFKSAFEKYYSLISEQQPKIQSGLDAMNTVSSSINGAHDLEAAIKNMRTGEPFPPDYMFEEKPVYEITGKRLGRSPSAIRSEKDEGGDLPILSMPHKTGKKAAQDKLKQYERELTELTQKLQSLENMFSVYEIYTEKDAKDPRYIQQLHEQKEFLEIRITNTQLKKHGLQEYIAQADGLAPPQLPKQLVGKKIQTPQREALSPTNSIAVSRQASMCPTPTIPSVSVLGVNLTPKASPILPVQDHELPNLDDDKPLSSLKTNAAPITPIIINEAPPVIVAVENEDDWTWHGDARSIAPSPSTQHQDLSFQPRIAANSTTTTTSTLKDPIHLNPPSTWTDWGASPASLQPQQEQQQPLQPTLFDLKISSASAINGGSGLNPSATGNFVYTSTAANPMNVSDLHLPRSAYDAGSTPKILSEGDVVPLIDGGGGMINGNTLFGAIGGGTSNVGVLGWGELEVENGWGTSSEGTKKSLI